MQPAGGRIGRQLEGPVDKLGRPPSQAMSYYAAAEVLLQAIRFDDSTTGAGAESEYPVIAVNGVGWSQSRPQRLGGTGHRRTDEEWSGLADVVSPALPSAEFPDQADLGRTSCRPGSSAAQT
jgi:hypothetical protein